MAARFDACNQDSEIHELKGCGMKILRNSEKKTTTFLIFPAGVEIDVNELPFQIPMSPDSLLPDENSYKEIKALVETYDFLTLRDKIKTFIEAGGVPEGDVAYMLLEKLDTEELTPAISKCTVTVDPVENKANVTYNGVSNITSNINVMSQIKNSDQEFWVGFAAPSWLFFTQYKIALGDSDSISSHFDYFAITREMIGGSVLEKVKTRFSAEEIEKICNVQEPIIRFADDENDKTRDHVITESEQDCLKTISFLRETYLGLSNTLFAWKGLYLE